MILKVQILLKKSKWKERERETKSVTSKPKSPELEGTGKVC
jgi:hypothetical protein